MPSPRGRSSTSAGPPFSWNSVNGARAKAVTLSFDTSRLILWLATPRSAMSDASTRSGSSRPERRAASSAAATLVFSTAANTA